MNRTIILCIAILAPLCVGCFNQKSTATRQRWMDIKAATDNLKDSAAIISQAKFDGVQPQGESELIEPMAQGTAMVEACKTFHSALTAQKSVNVDPKLNEIAQKLVTASESLLAQTQRGQEVFIEAKAIEAEIKSGTNPFAIPQLTLEAGRLMQEMNSAMQMGNQVLVQMNACYQELEALRPELNEKYKLELPEIKWVGQ